MFTCEINCYKKAWTFITIGQLLHKVNNRVHFSEFLLPTLPSSYTNYSHLAMKSFKSAIKLIKLTIYFVCIVVFAHKLILCLKRFSRKATTTDIQSIRYQNFSNKKNWFFKSIKFQFKWDCFARIYHLPWLLPFLQRKCHWKIWIES